MSQDTDVRAADPVLGRLADAILIPPFPGTAAPGWMLDALGRGLAGVTLFGQNIAAPGQVHALTTALRAAAAEHDPVIAIDEEGGDVTRVAYADGSPVPGNAALGAVDDVALTQAVYRSTGADLAALGINFDLAPCADVLGTADSPAVGTRSFGADTGLVSRHTAAAVAGLQSAGVAACTKHFPGHGRTGTDTHEAIATIEGSLAELRRVDLPPFEAAIRAGTLAIMPSHLRVPELTGDLPATVSAAAITGLLRGELGFTGVIVSDALEMRATRDMFGIPGAAVLAVAAGTDLLCLGRDGGEDEYLAVRDALVAAVRDGTLDGARLEEAADRVARLRGGLARARLSGAAPAGPVSAGPVSAGPVSAGPVSAGPVSAGPVSAGSVSAGPVSAGPVSAGSVSAGTAEFDQRRCRLFRRKLGVVVQVASQERDGVAWARGRDDRRWLAGCRSSGIERVEQRRDVVAVDLLHRPAERLPLSADRPHRQDAAGRALDLHAVQVDDQAEVVQPVGAGGHGGLPRLAFLHLAVAEHGVDPPVVPPAPVAERHADRDR
jgi:beta-N-acetylhexosaminidase